MRVEYVHLVERKWWVCLSQKMFVANFPGKYLNVQAVMALIGQHVTLRYIGVVTPHEWIESQESYL